MGRGWGFPKSLGRADRGTGIPGRRGARHRRGAGFCGQRAEDQVWGGTGMLAGARGEARCLLLGLGWVVPAPWGSVVGVASPLITLLPMDFVSLFLAPLPFMQLEGSLRPASSSQADTLIFLSLHARGWRQRGMGEPPSSHFPPARRGHQAPRIRDSYGLPSPVHPVPGPFIFLSFSLSMLPKSSINGSIMLGLCY